MNPHIQVVYRHFQGLAVLIDPDTVQIMLHCVQRPRDGSLLPVPGRAATDGVVVVGAKCESVEHAGI